MDEKPKLRRLKKLVASEVSLVNRGAVRRPFLIVKNKDGTVPDNAQRDLFALTPEQNDRIDAVIRKAGEFDESKHPRADNGEFGSGGGGGSKEPAGKQIGSTSSGKAVHENEETHSPHYSNFSSIDHADAAKAHTEAASKSPEGSDTQSYHREMATEHYGASDATRKKEEAADHVQRTSTEHGKKAEEYREQSRALRNNKIDIKTTRDVEESANKEAKRNVLDGKSIARTTAHNREASGSPMKAADHEKEAKKWERHGNRKNTSQYEARSAFAAAAEHREMAAAIGPKKSVSKADKDAENDFALADADADTDTPPDEDADDNMPDARSMAALKAVYRILLPFKGQISEDMVDDVLAELDLDDTGEDGQDVDDTADDEDVEGETDDINEEDAAMAKSDSMPDALKDKLEKGSDWSPSQPEGMSDDDYTKAVAAAKAAFSGACSKDAGDDEDEDEDDDDVKKNVTKSARPAHAQIVAKAEAEKKQWIAKAAELEARLGKMEDERVLKSHEDDVRRDCQVLGKDPAEQAVILKSAFGASEEAGKAYRQLLAESATMQREGVLKSVGTSSNASFGAFVPNDGQGSPRQQLEARVKGLVQKGECKNEADAWAATLETKWGQERYAADRNRSH